MKARPSDAVVQSIRTKSDGAGVMVGVSVSTEMIEDALFRLRREQSVLPRTLFGRRRSRHYEIEATIKELSIVRVELSKLFRLAAELTRYAR